MSQGPSASSGPGYLRKEEYWVWGGLGERRGRGREGEGGEGGGEGG